MTITDHMAGKKKTPKAIKKSKKPPLADQLIRVFAGILILIALVIAAGFITRHLFPGPKGSPSHGRSHQPVHKKHHGTYKIPRFEIFPKPDMPVMKPWKDLPPPEQNRLPKVAVIIDDMGYDKQAAEHFLSLNIPLTFAVLPFSPYQKAVVSMARKKKIELMLHLPLEPVEYPEINPGKGGIYASMTPDRLIDQLNKNLDAISHIKGVNNHMGSKITAMSDQMNQIFSILKLRKLFFIDSRTTGRSLCLQSARLFKVPFAQRDIFIDGVLTVEHMRNQIKRLIQIAGVKGLAVGIAHPHLQTYHVLRSLLPDLKKNVRLVPASEAVLVVR